MQSNLLKQEDFFLQKTIYIQEQIKLKSTDTIHNFTDFPPPKDITNLLNKGTNFIPTADKPSHSSINKRIISEVNEALIFTIRKPRTSYKDKTSKKQKHRCKPYTTNTKNPLTILTEEQQKHNFNENVIEYVYNTNQYAKEYVNTTNLSTKHNTNLTNISSSTLTSIQHLQNKNNFTITQTDKNKGWALLPTSWFTNEYNRHMHDTQTYKQIENFNLPQHITDSNNCTQKLKTRFKNLIKTSDKLLFNTLKPSNIHLPFMKLLPKVHKLSSSASPHLLDKLTGRPIITAHSWTTSNNSKILGTELDNIILKLKDHFITQNIPFPSIYNSSDLIDKLEQFTIKNIHDYSLTTFDFSSPYTSITYQDTTSAIIQSW